VSENIQPASEENKIVEDFEKENLSENSTGVNVEQPTLNLEQNRLNVEVVDTFMILLKEIKN